MKIQSSVMLMVSGLALLGGACAAEVAGSGTPNPPNPAQPDDLVPPASQIRQWQEEIDQFDGGYRPTGSPAHEGYIQLLAKRLGELGVSDVHLEPFTFNKWTPSSWSLELVSGPTVGPVQLAGYVPYSGQTGATGIQAGLAYLPTPASTLSALSGLDAAGLQNALAHPAQWQQGLLTDLQASLASLGTFGKIVIFDVPKFSTTIGTLANPTLFANDPTSQLGPSTAVSRSDLGAMLYVPAVLSAIAAGGAIGAIGIIDGPEQGTRAMYAPFFDTTTPNVPAVYVDRPTGESLKQSLARGSIFVAAKIVLQATVSSATSENVVGVIPGASPKELILSSHSDGTNSIEDNGPAAILALASYLQHFSQAQRARTVRIIFSGGHFVASLGLASYVLAHSKELTQNALAVLELEHLGTREWDEVSPGTMGLTGQVEPRFLFTWTNQPLVEASTAFAKQFPRTLVAGPGMLGEGHNFDIVPLIQYITMPKYLLLGHVPEVTSQFTDYDEMRREIVAFAHMTDSLAASPDSQLGVVKTGP